MITKDSNGQATFHLYGSIGAGWFDDGITAQGLTDALIANSVEKGAELNVLIHSPGGDVFEGIAIAGILDDYVTRATVMGLAASMASVIAMSCTECEMVQGSEMMLHNPWTGLMGDSKDLRKAADHLDQIREGLIGRYEKRLGDRAKIAEMLDGETWLTAEKAVEIGAADRIKAGTPIKMALMSNLNTKHASPFLIAASTDPYASKLQAEIQKHLDTITALEGEKNNLKLELENAVSAKSESAEKLAAIESDLRAITTARDEAVAALARVEQDAARKAALAGTEPIPSALLGDEGTASVGMTAYEKYKAISDPAKRREYFRNNQAAIFTTTPRG